MIYGADDSSCELYSQNIATESVAATDAVRRSSNYGQFVRSSSYEDIYVGTKLPGDEPPDDEDDVVDVTNNGDRYDSRPTGAALRRQSGRRSSSFENLYEMQKKEAVFTEERNEMENEDENFCMQQWQIRDSAEDLSEKDSVSAPVYSLVGDARKNSPIDITVESGLDRLGQSAGYSRNKTKRSSSHLLQHSMSYDIGPDRTPCKISTGSSLDGDDEAIDFQRERNMTSGIGNGCRCTVQLLYQLLLLVSCCESNTSASLIICTA